MALGGALQNLVGATQKLGKLAGKGMLREAALGASPYLTAFGNVVVAWLMLDQSLVAAEKLAGFDLPEGDERQKALEENQGAAFYHNKIQTAKFFVHQVLSQNSWKLAQVTTKDSSALDMVF